MVDYVGCCLKFVWFFFQAEDGIRDTSVTGVQTCALPIWSMASPLAESQMGRSPLDPVTVPRSEERRVGEEGRSRWSPYHLKKKKKATLSVESLVESLVNNHWYTMRDCTH